MNKLIFLALLLVASFAFTIDNQPIVSETVHKQLKAINWPFTTCGDGKWDIQKLTLGSTPARNSNDSIDVIGTARASITFSKVLLGVKLNGAPLHTETIPYTESYDNGDTVQFKFNNFVPSFAPSGTYGLTFQFVDKSGANNGCLSFQFKL